MMGRAMLWRHELAVMLWCGGVELHEIGARFGASRERVRRAMCGLSSGWF